MSVESPLWNIAIKMAGFVVWMNQHSQQYTGAKVGGNCLCVCDQNGWCVASTKAVLLTSGEPRLLHEAVELISSR